MKVHFFMLEFFFFVALFCFKFYKVCLGVSKASVSVNYASNHLTFKYAFGEGDVIDSDATDEEN